MDYENRILFLLDPGHSGVVDGEYLTAPDKMWEFDDGTIIYEGERNRVLASFIEELADMGGLLTYDVTGGSQLDIPLGARTKVANDLNDRYPHVVYCSLHMNAGGGRGMEIFTSPGQTASDHHASLVMDIMEEDIEDLVVRPDFHSDKDVDKEAKFWVLTKTNCPAWLIEVGFMDDYEDAKKLLDDEYLWSVAKAIVRYMKRAQEIELW
jgi:N-acetylmuramoyl-L-alanine amidase